MKKVQMLIIAMRVIVGAILLLDLILFIVMGNAPAVIMTILCMFYFVAFIVQDHFTNQFRKLLKDSMDLNDRAFVILKDIKGAMDKNDNAVSPKP